MELRHLRYFVAVAELENVSQAALKLHVSQPALSRQVRDLEDELGVALLERRAKSVHLTEAGRVFLTEARVVLERAEAAVKAARQAATGGELHVGDAPSVTARILPPALRAFRAARVKLHDLSTEEMLAGLREGKLDIALMARPTPAMLRGLRFVPLARDEYRVAVAPKHPLARKKSVMIPEILREPLIGFSRREYPEYHVALTGLLPKVRLAEEHDSVTGLIAAVEAGHGVAIVAKSIACVAGPRLKLIALSPTPKPLLIGAVLRKAKSNGLVMLFLRCLAS